MLYKKYYTEIMSVLRLVNSLRFLQCSSFSVVECRFRFISIYYFFSALFGTDRSDEELFRDLIMDPMPSSVTNLVSGVLPVRAGDSNTRFLKFQIAPEDFSNLITPGFESNLLSENVLLKILYT
jgi:hypothetical protein